MTNLTRLSTRCSLRLSAAPALRQTGVGELVQLAQELRDMPRDNFKKRLQLELEWEAAGRTVSSESEGTRQGVRAAGSDSANVLPSLFGKTWAGYPVRRINFALSVGAAWGHSVSGWRRISDGQELRTTDRSAAGRDSET